MRSHIFYKIIFFLLFTFAAATVSTAQSITHTIQDEETLFSIAQKYGVSVQQLQKWNNISGSAISIGQTLVIKQSEKEGTYTVKDGDTLFSIAQKFGVTVGRLKKWNNLEGAAISVGQALIIQPVKEYQPEKAIEPVEEPVSIPAVSGAADGYYTVKSGDTLFRIAQLFGMEVEKLKALNGLTSNNIRVGQELKVKAGSAKRMAMPAKPGAVIRYELKQGMGLKELLRVFDMSMKEFRQLNPEMKATYINKGQVVQVVVPKAEDDALPSVAGAKLTMLGQAEAEKYEPSKKGTVTTNGELYSPGALTAAHGTMAIGSVIFVKNPVNGRGVIVRINDRVTHKGLKLSKTAWQALGLSGESTKVILYRINE